MPKAQDEEIFSELAKEIRAMSQDLREEKARGPTQTIYHKTSGFGMWGAAAVVACFCTWFGLVLVMLDIHDMRAWVDILRQRVTILEGKR